MNHNLAFRGFAGIEGLLTAEEVTVTKLIIIIILINCFNH